MPEMKLVYDESEVNNAVRSLLTQVESSVAEYEGKDITILSILKGGVFLGTTIATYLSRYPELNTDMIGFSSYPGDSVDPVHSPLMNYMPSQEALVRKAVVIVDDIVDTGATMRYAMRFVAEYAPDAIIPVALIDRPGLRKHSIGTLMSGIRTQDTTAFLVGWGMGLDNRYRHLSDIHGIERG